MQDGSGTITTKELLPVLRSIGQNPTEDEILGLVIEYDVNGDGTIDFDEFIEMMTKVRKSEIMHESVNVLFQIDKFMCLFFFEESFCALKRCKPMKAKCKTFL